MQKINHNVPCVCSILLPRSEILSVKRDILIRLKGDGRETIRLMYIVTLGDRSSATILRNRLRLNTMCECIQNRHYYG